MIFYGHGIVRLMLALYIVSSSMRVKYLCLLLISILLSSSLAFAADKSKKQSLGDTACAVGEVVKYDGTSWVCATDEDSPTTTLDWNDIQNRPTGLDDGDDDTDTDTLGALSCANGEVAKADSGGSWVCGPDETGNPSVDTLATLNCSEGDVARYNGSSWVCSDAITRLELFQFGKRVFLTKEQFTGNLGGLDGADATCQQLAGDAGLPGIYRAWLSDLTGSPSTRFTQSSTPYFLLNGTVIADDWADLTDGELNAPIHVYEDGTVRPIVEDSLETVWSGTDESGALNTAGGFPFYCSNWTSDLGLENGYLGSPNSAGTPSGAAEVPTGGGLVRLGWTRVNSELTPGSGTFGESFLPCQSQRRFYCFQQ